MPGLTLAYTTYVTTYDPRALTDLLTEARRIALATARSLRCSEPEDVAQGMMLKVSRDLNKYNPARASLATWIRSMTRYAVLDHFRRTEPTQSLDETTVPEPEPISYATINPANLSPEDQRTLAVFYLDRNFDSAAATLRISVPALKRRLYRLAQKKVASVCR